MFDLTDFCFSFLVKTELFNTTEMPYKYADPCSPFSTDPDFNVQTKLSFYTQGFEKLIRELNDSVEALCGN